MKVLNKSTATSAKGNKLTFFIEDHKLQLQSPCGTKSHEITSTDDTKLVIKFLVDGKEVGVTIPDFIEYGVIKAMLNTTLKNNRELVVFDTDNECYKNQGKNDFGTFFMLEIGTKETRKTKLVAYKYSK
jgi:hypothetical protein